MRRCLVLRLQDVTEELGPIFEASKRRNGA